MSGNHSENIFGEVTRRQLIRTSTAGIAGLALSVLAHEDLAVADENITADQPKSGMPHFRPRAKSVIYLSMNGGPSQVDTFDYKPVLQKSDGKSAEVVNGGTASRLARKGKLWASPWKFSQHGQSGLHLSELFPHIAKHVDDLCIINSMHTDVSAHALATQMQFTGSFQFTRPSVGSWVLYGLGSEANDIPGFVSLRKREFGPGFLPSNYRATELDAKSGVSNIHNDWLTRAQQRAQLDLLSQFDRSSAQSNPALTEVVDGVHADYEMAFRMQSSLPAVLDVKDAPQKLLEEYGITETATRGFGLQCLVARRLIQQGVRFVQLESGGWDQHHTLVDNLKTQCESTDQPIAALLADLKRHDLLKDTLVIWGGEFGRTPFSEDWPSGRMKGRDHNAVGYTMWLAGGGVKGGMRYGMTDELGSQAVEDRMHLHDLHATVLHLLGLDHTRLTFRYGGRDFRLTDVHGDVAHKIIA